MLKREGLWGIVSGRELRPEDAKAIPQADWDRRAEKAAGSLMLLTSPDQRTHIRDCQDDPCKVWERLESVHVSERPGARFDAHEDPSSVRKEEEEGLDALARKVDEAMTRIKNL